MSFNFCTDSIEFKVMDGVMFGCMVFHYTTPHDKAMFFGKDLNNINQITDLDYFIFDDNRSVKIIFTLKKAKDFKDFGDLKRLFKPDIVKKYIVKHYKKN